MPAFRKFDPSQSRVSEDALLEFLKKPISGDLEEVPGVGDVTRGIFEDEGVTNTFQLVAKFISFITKEKNCAAHCQDFYNWLQSIHTPPKYRAGIVVAVAEKVTTWMPGVYDPAVFVE
jgi:hypothetical protein